MSCEGEKKTRLRTFNDVVARLIWSPQPENQQDDVFLGYHDRIHGWLEKNLHDHKSIGEGGDVPSHRYFYVRVADEIVWDRVGRVDKIFGSGEGANQTVAEETRQRVREAKVNMRRLEEERQQRRAIRQKERARKVADQKKRSALLNPPNNRLQERYKWNAVVPRSFDNEQSEWVVLVEECECSKEKRGKTETITSVTWNVLMDLFDKDDDSESSSIRWQHLMNELVHTDADVIAFQEVTPRFLSELLKQPWIRNQYSVSSLPQEAHPFANVMIWKPTTLLTLSLFMCVDGDRKRLLLGHFQHKGNPSCKCVISNVHLLANQQTGKSRKLERRREVGILLAQISRVIEIHSKSSIIILGDFDDEDDLFQGHLIDAWSVCGSGSGFTFDPSVNPRTLRTKQLTKSTQLEPQRIDKMYCGIGTNPISANLIGLDFPPSDHFGVIMVCDLSCDSGYSHLNAQNLWASLALPSSDTLLGIALDKYPTEVINAGVLNTCSLPIPHLTVMHGFADLLSALDVTVNAVAEAVASWKKEDGDETHYVVYEEGLRVLEHQCSATLVRCPEMIKPEMTWLKSLYDTLHKKFSLCHEQESRFVDGWLPHVSLGTFGTAAAARAHGSDTGGLPLKVSALGLTLFQRGLDHQFHARAVVPFAKSPIRRSRKHVVKHFLDDAGRSWNLYFKAISQALLSEISRAFQYVLSTKGAPIIHLFGSHALNAALPGISDVDVLVELGGKDWNLAETLSLVAAHFRVIHPHAKIRMREAVSTGIRIPLLTIHLWNGAPTIDVQVAFRPSHETDLQSQICRQSFLSVIETAQIQKTISSDLQPVFAGALRIIKLWCHQRKLNGLGFLGGGGWALWLLAVVSDMVPDDLDKVRKLGALYLVVTFFKAASIPAVPIVIRSPKSKATPGFECQMSPPLVLCALNSDNNYGRNVTKFTAEAIAFELRRAANVIKQSSGLAPQLQLCRVMDEVNIQTLGFSSVVQMRVGMSDSVEDVIGLQYLGSRACLGLTIDLERRVSAARPFLIPIWKAKTLMWSIALEAVAESDLGHSWCTVKAIEIRRIYLQSYDVEVCLTFRQLNSSHRTLN